MGRKRGLEGGAPPRATLVSMFGSHGERRKRAKKGEAVAAVVDLTEHDEDEEEDGNNAADGQEDAEVVVISPAQPQPERTLRPQPPPPPPPPKPRAAPSSSHAPPRPVVYPRLAPHPFLKHVPPSLALPRLPPGTPTPYRMLAECFAVLADNRGRLLITDCLTHLFLAVMTATREDVVGCVYLCVGRGVSPVFAGDSDFGLGSATINQAISEATGTSRKRISALWDQFGDIGDVAFLCRQRQRVLVAPAPLTVRHVVAALKGLTTEGGAGSVARKRAAVSALFTRGSDVEVRFLARTLAWNLRLGANERTVINALARASVLAHFGDPQQHDKGKQQELANAIEIGVANSQRALAIVPDYELVWNAIETHGPHTDAFLRECSMRCGVPLKPMLAQPSHSIASALDALWGHPFTCEFKYDGMRAQVHHSGETGTRIFSRNLEDQTARYPDVIVHLLESNQQRCSSFVLDCEVVGVKRLAEGGVRILPMQMLSTRPRSVDLGSAEAQVSVCAFLFDLLMVNGEDMLGVELCDRRQRMQDLFSVSPGRVEMSQSLHVAAHGGLCPHCLPSAQGALGEGEGAEWKEAKVVGEDAGNGEGENGEKGSKAGEGERGEEEQSKAAELGDAEGSVGSRAVAEVGASGEGGGEGQRAGDDDPERASAHQRITAFLELSLRACCEGLMLKALHGPKACYRSGERSSAWVKVKKDYLEGLGDSFDVVPVGVWRGMGRKSAWFSPILVAVYDPDTETFQTLCKVMSGFSDAFYQAMTDRLRDRIVPTCPSNVDSRIVPAHYIEPCEVWEVAGADLTESPSHTCGGSLLPDACQCVGVGLRFPRFVRVREDKRVEEASTTAQVVGMFNAQNQRVGLDIKE